MPTIRLPASDGTVVEYAVGTAAGFRSDEGAFNRIAYAAVHVVADPLSSLDPWMDTAIDWESTIAYRRHIWDLGLGVAEAMDTAQRGMGLDWPAARELIQRSLAASHDDDLIACGVGTDHLQPNADVTVDDVMGAYDEQFEFVESLGGRCIMMASRALAACARGPDDFERVYDRILSQAQQPVIIHWLGEMFDPALAGYWGHEDHERAMDVCIAVIESSASKVDGIKISLLDKDAEIAMRRRLPEGVRMYTGDDFDFATLIAGDELGYSDALLGIFDAIAPAAATALGFLSRGDMDSFHRVLAPTVPLSRYIFQAPTRFYKTGIVLLAYLNGHQDHFVMVGGQESARSTIHLAQVFRLADQAGLLRDPDLAVERMKPIMAARGVD